MRQARPVAAIAEVIGLAPDQTRKIITRLKKELGLEYKPPRLQPRILFTDQSREFRNSLGNMLYGYRERSRKHPTEIAMELGLLISQQKKATERGGQHDWKISEIERLAAARGESFKQAGLRALLTKEEYQIVAKCLNI